MKLTVIAAPLLIVVALSPFALGQTADSRSTSAGGRKQRKAIDSHKQTQTEPTSQILCSPKAALFGTCTHALNGYFGEVCPSPASCNMNGGIFPCSQLAGDKTT